MILTKKLIIKMDKEYNLANYMIILLTITLITFLNSYLTTLNGTQLKRNVDNILIKGLEYVLAHTIHAILKKLMKA